MRYGERMPLLRSWRCGLTWWQRGSGLRSWYREPGPNALYRARTRTIDWQTRRAGGASIMHRRTIATLDARLELVSNLDLIFDPRYFSLGKMESLLTDFGHIADVPAEEPPDATLYV